MTRIHIRDLKSAIDDKSTGMIIECNGKKHRVQFNRVKVGYGIKIFFSCPLCGANCEILYYEKGWYCCFDCCSVKPYRGIQNSTKGGYEYISYKMERFAMKCGIGRFDYPFDYEKHPRPKGKHKDKWEKNLSIMQCLENMRSQSIFFNKIWDSKTIQSVEQGRNKYISFPLGLLKKNFYHIEKGDMTHL